MPTLPPSQGPPSTVHWRFACQKRNGTSYLHLLELSPYDNGPAVLAKLRAEYDRVTRAPPYNFWDQRGIFWDHVIEVAVLSENSTTDLEAQRGPRYVLVSDRRRDAELTAAFRNPDILSNAECFVRRNEKFAVHRGSTGLQERRYAIRIGQELNWLGIWVPILSGAVFCIIVGVVVGVLVNSVDLGIGVTSGLATVIACLEAFAFWAYK